MFRLRAFVSLLLLALVTAEDAASVDSPAPPDFARLRVKELKEIIASRGADCVACGEKADLVAKAAEVWELPLVKPAAPVHYETPEEIEEIMQKLRKSMPNNGRGIPGFDVLTREDMRKMREKAGSSDKIEL